MSSGSLRLRSETIGGRAHGPHLLITGGVHGDEFEPMAAIRRLLSSIDTNSLCGSLTLVPVVNEAAFARGSRVAEDGLDLARTCPGRANGSITEQTAHALSELIRTADYYIDMHTGGLALSVWPLAGYMLHPDAAVLKKQRAMARAFNLPVVWGTDHRLDGRSLSVARDANVPAIYVEYLGGGSCSEEGITAMIDGCLNVMAALQMIDCPQPRSRVQFVVEDPRPGSGHMQHCHPSPADGFFEPSIGLGEPIIAGQSLGQVVDPLGQTTRDVLAAETGRVLVVRTLPAVRKGDSLAVILPAATSNA
ncbi:MAG TPA: M14 family metallopeptidase [Pirellulaceae bacterium]|jgi:predicted deacylase